MNTHNVCYVLNLGGGFWKWHFGQTSASGAVHWPQNLIPSGLSKLHLEQRIAHICPNVSRPGEIATSRRVMDLSV
jgi:hypothetical protein